MRSPLLLAAFSALTFTSCYSPGDGRPPPLEKLYFPTGLALDTVTLLDGAPAYLYVASSDFDLQYRSAALASYDLELVRRIVPRSCVTRRDCAAEQECDTEPSAANGYAPSYFCVATSNASPCGAFGPRSAGDQLLNPGRCQAVDPLRPQDGSQKLVKASVGIGAFAADVILRANPNAPGRGRLFLPVRGDATLHWIDVTAQGEFECGQSRTDDGSCDGAHRSGDLTSDNANGLRQPAEPFGIAVTANGDYIAITNQTSGSVSLFANDWQGERGPTLETILTGLPQAPVAIAAVPSSGLPGTENAAPGFLVAYRNAARVDLLRVRSDAADTASALASYTRYALTYAGSAPITANSLGFDSRSIVIDDEARRIELAACAADPDCDPTGVRQPDLYVANRAPASLLIGAFSANGAYAAGSSQLPAFSDSIPLTVGPSRVALGKVKVPSAAPDASRDASGPFALERRVFVVCFDSRRIFVYDPKRRQIEGIVHTGRGPYALAVDDVRGLAYVAHFTDSYLGVVSLDQRFPQTYATIVASIGVPTPPRSSK